MSESEANVLEQLDPGLRYLSNGYIDYAKSVIGDRALADYRDGLKPVQRRIMYLMKLNNIKRFTKCAKLSGDASCLHPHGEGSVYEALVLMTDRNGSLAFPLVAGRGSFGGFYKTDTAAAMRYTEAMPSANTEEYFGEMNGIEMMPNFDSTMEEPTALSVNFPSVLVNGSTGIAVGFKANIPTFNFNDVCNLVKEYITTGDCTTVICPDFVSGGYYVKNNKELQKLMRTGTGKIKLRGRVDIVGNTINVVEIPYGKTLQGLVKQINALDSKSIKRAYDADDSSHGLIFTVACKSAQVTNEVLYQMYKNTDFQYNYSADITVVDNGVPMRIGVWQLVKKWTDWRAEVLVKEYTHRLNSYKEAIKQSLAFMEIIKYPELKDKLVYIITHDGKPAGVQFVKENFDSTIITPDLASWCCDRRLPDFHTGGKYLDVYNKSVGELSRCEDIINNPLNEVLRETDVLLAKYGKQYQRKTEVTLTDYEFADDSTQTQQVVDSSPCTYALRDGFLKKMRYNTEKGASRIFDGMSDDVIIALDNRGRIIRVYASDIPYHGADDTGLYLPRYCDLLTESDDYRITWAGRLTGSTLLLLYKDGNIGYIGTSEWQDNSRKVKVLEKGFAPSVANKLGAVVDLGNYKSVEDLMLYMVDAEGRLAWEYLRNIKRKDRQAKTRVLNLVHDVPLDSFALVDSVKGALLFNNCEKYYGKLKHCNYETEFNGETSDFTDMF